MQRSEIRESAPGLHSVSSGLRQSRGFTLIELIVVTVVISIVAVGLFGVFMKAVSGSADPMLNMQAIAIAQGYLEEALLQPYSDPNGGETGSCEEGARQNYDDVQDYDCINDTGGALDQFGNPLAGLGAYNVSITVTSTTLGGGNPAAAQEVQVTVSHDALPNTITLVGYRANY
ncbi:MAG: prepilin-type N-terminal cleavage/methylation domain-containing protein [Gammaproteobacteria bacterium]|nr:prepilin-type N-terminal cleavage/methylation domain-containing protein [Gammaproteobacteria bacterium]